MTFSSLLEIVADVDVAGSAFDARQPIDRLAELRAQQVHVDAGLRQQPAHRAALLLEQRRHQVHRLDELVIPADGQRLRVLQRLREVRGQFVHAHGNTLLIDWLART